MFSNQKSNIFTILLAISLFSSILSGCTEVSDSKNRFSGTVEGTEMNINAEVGGKITDMNVEEGSQVKKGQQLGLLDTTVLALQVKQAESVLTAAQEKSKETKKGNRQELISQAQSTVAQITSLEKSAKETMMNAKDLLDKTQKLSLSGGATEQQVTDAQTKYEVAKAQLNAYNAQKSSAMDQLRLLQNGATLETIHIADASVTQAEIGLLTAKAQLEKAILTAPVNGIVDSVNFTKGEVVSPGASVITLMNPNDLWIKIFVPEQELPKVKIGQKAKIYIDAYPDKPFSGTVEFISSKAEFTPKNLQTQEERVNLVFAVKVKITSGKDQLKPGLPADVEIVTE